MAKAKSDKAPQKAPSIAEFEETVIRAIMGLGLNAFGNKIIDRITAVYEMVGYPDRRVTVGALYTTLNRLEDKGLVTYDLHISAESKRASKRYQVTGLGEKALEQTIQLRARMAVGLDGQIAGEEA